MRHHTAYAKYSYYLRKYSSRRKLGNILLNRYESSRLRPVLKSRPYKITIDPGNFCNLRCPGCHTGIKHPEMITPSFMSLENYRTIYNRFREYAVTVALYNWGEPFLNKNLFGMIDYTHSNGTGTTVHSNFNVFNEQMAVDAVKSGLTHIYLSIDGVSNDAYTAYRVKGNINTVLDNLRIMLETKKRMKSRFPLLTWKFLEFEHNRHELKEAAEMAAGLGVDAFEHFKAYPKLTDIYEQAEDYRKNPAAYKRKGICSSLWSGIYVQPDGTVLPCSLAYRPGERFGNLLENDLDTVWNNAHYVNARKLFTGSFDPDAVPVPCRSCVHFLMRNCDGKISQSQSSST